MKKRVFIGSSSEELGTAKIVKEILEKDFGNKTFTYINQLTISNSNPDRVLFSSHSINHATLAVMLVMEMMVMVFFEREWMQVLPLQSQPLPCKKISQPQSQ